MANVNNIKIGDKTPDAIMSPHSKKYKLNFKDWVITEGCIVEISDDGGKVQIKKFNPKKYCLKADTEKLAPLTQADWEAFAYPWFVKIEGLENALTNLDTKVNDRNTTTYPGSHVTNTYSNSLYYIKGFSLCPLLNSVDEEMWRVYPWDMGVHGLDSYGNRPYKDWGYGGNTVGYINDYDRVRVISNTSMTYTTPLIPCIGIYGNFTNVDSEGFVDISDSPITITFFENSEYLDSHNDEFWKVYYGNSLVYEKDKTVDNCLIRYYKGYITEKDGDISAGIRVFPTVYPDLDLDKAVYKWPNASDITDLNSYNITNLKLEQEIFNSNSYVDWFSNSFANYSHLADYYNLKLGGTKILNTEDRPLVLDIIAEGDLSTSLFRTLDGLFCYGISSSQTNINYLKIRLKRLTSNDSWIVSTAQKMLYKFKGSVDIVSVNHLGEELEGRTVFVPTQLDGTFEYADIDVIKREWLSLSRCNSIPWVCDGSSITEFQSTENPQIITIKKVGNFYNPSYYKWPEGIMYDEETQTYKRENTIGWAQQAFANCSNLTRIEPIINVRFVHSVEQIKWMFTGCSKLTHLRLQGLNCFNWDFTSSDLQLDNLDAESIKYIFDNLEDLQKYPFNANNTDSINDDPTTVGIERAFPVPEGESFDYVNFRTKTSSNGLSVIIPQIWADKGYITEEIVNTARSKGWKVVLNAMPLSL